MKQSRVTTINDSSIPLPYVFQLTLHDFFLHSSDGIFPSMIPGMELLLQQQGEKMEPEDWLEEPARNASEHPLRASWKSRHARVYIFISRSKRTDIYDVKKSLVVLFSKKNVLNYGSSGKKWKSVKCSQKVLRSFWKKVKKLKNVLKKL